eukprot:1525797-Rhodomonas_salina.1
MSVKTPEIARNQTRESTFSERRCIAPASATLQTANARTGHAQRAHGATDNEEACWHMCYTPDSKTSLAQRLWALAFDFGSCIRTYLETASSRHVTHPACFHA